jgi:hypothetical protein
MKTVKIVGMAHSKLRNSIGVVGIEVDPAKQEVYVKMANHWERDDINSVAPDVAKLYAAFEWDNTIIDLSVGEHVIQGLRRTSGLPIRVIFVKKKVTDVSEIRRVKTLDLIEMVQFLLQQKLAHKIKFPTQRSPTMKELEDQIALYAEKTTEAGGVDYYAPGDELDDLTKGLMLAVFAARPFLQDSVTVVAGPLVHKPMDQLEYLQNAIDPQPKHKKKIRGI